MRTLNLRIKKIYFDKIASGEKIYEYRKNNAFYKTRFDKKPEIISLHYQQNLYLDCRVLEIDIIETPPNIPSEFVSTPTCYRIRLEPIKKYQGSVTEKKTEKYNGWTNRPTWAAHLWLTNDEFMYSNAYRNPRVIDFFLQACKDNRVMLEDCEPIEEINWEEIIEHLTDE